MVRVVSGVLFCVVDCVAGSERGDEKKRKKKKKGNLNLKLGVGLTVKKQKGRVVCLLSPLDRCRLLFFFHSFLCCCLFLVDFVVVVPPAAPPHLRFRTPTRRLLPPRHLPVFRKRAPGSPPRAPPHDSSRSAGTLKWPDTPLQTILCLP
ncbi:hypothetical protein BKA57DRAFT_104033 [Linnemannia elongata]|nr:hypothetical protein BKA57DRAFT_104033 [Linnemannia elongata]